MSRLDQAILAALRDHPHDDTLSRLLDVLGGPVDAQAVSASLDRLLAAGLVATAGGHWQLTAAGFRLQRAA
jgi:hypothetical protein